MALLRRAEAAVWASAQAVSARVETLFRLVPLAALEAGEVERQLALRIPVVLEVGEEQGAAVRLGQILRGLLLEQVAQPPLVEQWPLVGRQVGVVVRLAAVALLARVALSVRLGLAAVDFPEPAARQVQEPPWLGTTLSVPMDSP